MALTIYEIKDQSSGSMVTINERLWLTADQSRIVKDGDPEAAYLFAAPGKQVSASEIKRLGGLPETKQGSQVNFDDFSDEVDEEHYSSLTIEELKDELRAFSLSVSGNKAELVARLIDEEG